MLEINRRLYIEIFTETFIGIEILKYANTYKKVTQENY